MFLEHFMKILKNDGRAGIVIKNTFLSNDDAALLRKELLKTCNLELVLDLPANTFPGAELKLLFCFSKKAVQQKRYNIINLTLIEILEKLTL